MKRLLTAAAILGLVAFMLPATAGIALGAPPPPYCINIVKTDDSGNTLPQNVGGAEFTITPGGGQTGTDGSGLASFCDLAAGDYVVTESGPPLGYSGAAPQPVTLPAGSDNGNATLTFVDKPLPPTVEITLHKVVESGSALASAFDIMLWPMPSAYHDGETVTVVPGSYNLNEMPPPGGMGTSPPVYYEKSVICTSDGGSQGRNFPQPYPRAGGQYNGLNLLVGLDNPLEVWVCTITNTDAPTEPAPITGWKVSTADCTTVDGHGSITVTGFTDPADKQQVAVTPGDLVITKDGTYQLDPGTYNWFYGDRIGGGGGGVDFTIGPCPSPSPSPSASPSPSPSASPVASPTPKPAVTPTPKPTSTTLPAAITLPQTGTIGASTGGSSSPLVPISIALLLVAATGLMLTRRPKSR